MRLRRIAAMTAAAGLLAACGLVDNPLTLEGPSSAPSAEPDAGPGRDIPSEPSEPSEPDRPVGAESAPAPDPRSSLPAAPPEAEPFERSPAETHPNAKRLAAEVVRALLDYGPRDGLADIAARVAEGHRRDALVDAAAPLYHEDSWSRGEIVYAQFGGLSPDATAQMVVARQTVGFPDGRTEEQVRTLDVRLRLSDGAWLFDRLASAGGEPSDVPEALSPEARAVLDDDRIDLPDSARWDILRGAILPELLGLMRDLADEVGPYGVIVLQTGHPFHVFATDRMSDHMLGRAFDVHRIGDTLVVDDRAEGSRVHATVAWLYEHPMRPIIGSPWALDAFGGRSFTDTVHLDHLHVAIPKPRDRDDPADEELA